MRSKIYSFIAAVMFVAVSTTAHAGVGITNTWFGGTYHYWSSGSTLHVLKQQPIVGLCRTEVWGKLNGNLQKLRTVWNNGHNKCPVSFNQITLAIYSQQWDNIEVRMIRQSNGQRVGTATFKVVFN